MTNAIIARVNGADMTLCVHREDLPYFEARFDCADLAATAKFQKRSIEMGKHRIAVRARTAGKTQDVEEVTGLPPASRNPLIERVRP
ncbi:hypothetical protein, partial [Mesorhizobium sp. B2-6-7]|uniref:hypothetical protein n=1 Tax=Mesorhizobium sp. B2-6-7 TaxID=2589910 RepID=UPI001AEDC70D